MDNELKKPHQARRKKPKMQGMVFRWRIGAYEPHRKLRTGTHTSTEPPTTLLSPVHVYRMNNDTLRLDPMSSLPIPADRTVQQMVDYYLQVLSLQRHEPIRVDGHPNPSLSIAFRFSLQSPPWFEASVAIWRSLWLAVMGTKLHGDPFLILHQGNALSLLRQRLSHNVEVVDDDLMMTAFELAALEIILDNHDGVEAHLKGIRQMKRFWRSCEDESPLVQYITNRVEYVERLALTKLRAHRSHGSTISEASHEDLRYPTHPFPLDLCRSLERLPEGYMEVAMSGALSYQMIDFLIRLSGAKSAPSLHHLDGLQQVRTLGQITEDLLASFPASDMTEIERFLFHGLLALTLQLDENKQNLVHTAMGVKDKRRAFANLRFSHPILHRGCVIWSYVSFAGAGRVHDSSYADHILDLVFSEFPECQDWECLEATIHRFFWTENIKQGWKHCWESAMNARLRKVDVQFGHVRMS